MAKAILFDMDGVLTLPEEVFSVVYSRSRGLDVRRFDTFFTEDWPEFVTGKRDLKQHIADHPELWQWDGTPQELLDYWFKTEDVRNDALIEIIRDMRKQGVKCYVATEQEKYRTQYVRDVMFPDEFDGFFSTAEIGYRKTDQEFYKQILERIGARPDEVVFYDDSESKLAAAREVGIDARLYRGVEYIAEAKGRL